MDIAVVILPENEPGGRMRYMVNIAHGLLKYNIQAKYIFIDKGKKFITYQRYIDAGLPKQCAFVTNVHSDAVRAINKCDVALYADALAAFDYLWNKKHPDMLPWWYDDILYKIDVPAAAILHSAVNTFKYSPYLHIWEDRCVAFLATRTNVAELYSRKRGNTDCHIIGLPYDCSVKHTLGDKERLICTTARISANKRQFHIAAAMKQLQQWRLEYHYNSVCANYWTKRQLLEYTNEISNIEHCEYDGTMLHDDQIDEIYKHAALTYNSLAEIDDCKGGIEYVTIEGAMRGAVPILSPEWVAPNNDSPPEDACYKFDIYSKSYGGTENNIHEIVSSIDIASKDYRSRQRAIIDFITATCDYRVVIPNLLEALSDIL